MVSVLIRMTSAHERARCRFSAPGCPFCDQMRGMLCFALEDVRSTLREVNVEDEATLQKESSALQIAARAVRTIPELWLVSADGKQEELIGDSEALNRLMSEGSLAQRLESFGIPHLLDDE
jgi:glutaredoxin